MESPTGGRAGLPTITATATAESRLRVEHAVTLALARATDLADGTTGVLDAIRDAVGAEWAALWVVAADAGLLRCAEVRALDGRVSPEFVQASRDMRLARGTGLPGRVWDSGRPAWITDVQADINFPRQAAAARAGLHGAFALPVPGDGAVVAVVECLSRDIRQPDAPLLETLESVGRQFGQFLERRRAMDKLRRQQDHLAAIVEVSLDCVISMDDRGRVTEWNPAAERAFGYRRHETLGRELADLIIPAQFQDAHRAGLQHYLVSGEGPVLNRRVELSARRADGSEFPVELTVTRVRGDGPPLFTGFLRDITGRKAAQEELERGRALFRSIAEATPDVLSLYDLDSRTMVYANREIAAVLGHTADEVTALGAQAVDRLVHPDDLARMTSVIDRFVDLAEGEVAEYEYRARHKSGEYRWLQGRSVVFSRRPDGRPQQVLSIAQDVTRRRQGEESLRESEERLRLGLEAGNTGTWDWDIRAGRIAWSERVYAFHGLERAEFSGRLEDFQRLIHPDDAPRVSETVARSLETGARYEIEFRVRTPAGRVNWLATTGQVYRDEAGQPVRMLGATTDITARKEAELERDRLLASERAARSEAERANRLKDEFLATVSHELRTPLSAMLGWTQVLRRRNPDRVIEEGLAVIERNARLQAGIIDDLLDMSRIGSGKLRLDVQSVDLSQVIEAALQTVQPAAQARDIRLLTTLDPSAGPVSGDPSRLQQVVWNLLANAVKFTPKGGRVQVVLARVNSHVEIAVTDNGSGIAPEFLPHVFDKFRQSDASVARTHGGLGLGLAIVRSLVEMHGGTARASSPGIGGGATFVVELPLSPIQLAGQREDRRHPTSVPATAPARLPQPPDLAGFRVLVVDDERDGRELVCLVLEEYGAQVVTAAGATEALAVLRQQPVDLMLCDIGMPEIDGYELMRRVRALGAEAGGDVPAAALTAFARSEDRTRAMMAGYQAHIAKPADPLELAALVARLARRRGAVPAPDPTVGDV